MTPADTLEAAANEAQRAGRPAEAVRLLREAVALEPESAERINSLANALVRAGQLHEARPQYERAIALDPGFHKPVANLGRICVDLGDLAGARTWLARAVELNPEAFRTHASLAGVQARLNLRHEARASYLRAVELSPDFAPGWLGLAELAGPGEDPTPFLSQAWRCDKSVANGQRLAEAQLRGGHVSDALFTAREVLGIDPDAAAARALREQAIARLAANAPEAPDVVSHPGEALTWSAVLLLRRDPVRAGAILGQIPNLQPPQEYAPEIADRFAAIGTHEEAVGAYRAALRRYPRSTWCAVGCAQSLVSLRDAARALALLEPLRAEWRTDLRTGVTAAEALTAASRLHDAVDVLVALADRFPAVGAVHERIVTPLLRLGRVEEALAHLEVWELLEPERATSTPGLLNYHYRALGGAADRAERHAAWGHRASQSCALADPAPLPGPLPSILRVAYLSSDFVSHPVTRFFLPLLRAHDRSAVEVHIYSGGALRDDVTEEIEALAHRFTVVDGWSPVRIAEQLRADAIDVAIDLAGHTAGSLVRALAYRAAPMQATWLGYPNGSGLPTVDYRITDADADPVGIAEGLHVERLLRLPEGAWCFSPEQSLPITPSPALRNGYVTFASFNNNAKVSPESIELWSTVLLAVPESRLAIKSNALRDPATHRAMMDRLAAHGIPAERVVLLPWESNALASYQRVDVALDCSPYNGTTTTCEALWMGVPTLTLSGDGHVSRVGTSLMRRVGLPQYAAGSESELVAQAQAVAADLSGLAELRQGLRGRMEACALGDGRRFARQFEAALRAGWTDLASDAAGRPRLAPVPSAARVVAVAPGIRVPFGADALSAAASAFAQGGELTAFERVVGALPGDQTRVIAVGPSGWASAGRLVAAGSRASVVLVPGGPADGRLLAEVAPAWATVAEPSALGSWSGVSAVIGSGGETVARAVVGAVVAAGQWLEHPVVVSGAGSVFIASGVLPTVAAEASINTAARSWLRSVDRLCEAAASPELAAIDEACAAHPTLGDAAQLVSVVGRAVADGVGLWSRARSGVPGTSGVGALLAAAHSRVSALDEGGLGLEAQLLVARVRLEAGDGAGAATLLARARASLGSGACPAVWLEPDDGGGSDDPRRSVSVRLLGDVLRTTVALSGDPDVVDELVRQHAGLHIRSAAMSRRLLAARAGRLQNRLVSNRVGGVR